MAGDGPEDERELLEERRARVLAIVAQCKPQAERAQANDGLFAAITLDPRLVYNLCLAAEAFAEAHP